MTAAYSNSMVIINADYKLDKGKRKVDLMGNPNNEIKSILGVDVRIRSKTHRVLNVNEHVQKPIIHREIQGDKIFVAFNLWSRE
ncbi:hypothetical protein WMZ97_10870 [Lentibacillus sp. N15]